MKTECVHAGVRNTSGWSEGDSLGDMPSLGVVFGRKWGRHLGHFCAPPSSPSPQAAPGFPPSSAPSSRLAAVLWCPEQGSGPLQAPPSLAPEASFRGWASGMVFVGVNKHRVSQ